MTGYTNYQKCFEEADRIIKVLENREKIAARKRKEKELKERRLAEINRDYETLEYYEEMDRINSGYYSCDYEPNFDELGGFYEELEKLLNSMDRIPIDDEIDSAKDPILIRGLHKKFPNISISTLEDITDLVYEVYSDLDYETNNNIIRCFLAVFALSTYDYSYKYDNIEYNDIYFLRKNRILDREIKNLKNIIVSDVVSKMHSIILNREWGDSIDSILSQFL